LLYLCCLLPPEKDRSRSELEIYARDSQWIAAPNEEEATKVYQKRYPNSTKWRSNSDIKILSKSPRLLNTIKDGDNGYIAAIKALIDYLDVAAEEAPIVESPKHRSIRRNHGG